MSAVQALSADTIKVTCETEGFSIEINTGDQFILTEPVDRYQRGQVITVEPEMGNEEFGEDTILLYVWEDSSFITAKELIRFICHGYLRRVEVNEDIHNTKH